MLSTLLHFGDFLVGRRHRSSSPNVFGSNFFEFIKGDLLEAVIAFFSGAALPKFFTALFTFLIPKVENPTSFEKIWTISLCSMAYKILSKLTVGRLSGCQATYTVLFQLNNVPA